MRDEMKSLLILTSLLFTLSACVGISTQVENSTIRTLTPNQLITPSLTRLSTRTPTITPYPSSTPTLVPGAMTRTELEERIERWINGDIQLLDVDRLLDEVTAVPLDLGLYYSASFWTVPIYFSLGFTVINDYQGVPYVIGIAGFEDPQGTRFTLPIHAGALFEDCPDLILRIWERRRINYGTQIYEDFFITPMSFLNQSDLLTDTIVIGDMEIGSIYRTEGRCRNISLDYFELSNEATTSLIDYYGCEDCSFEDLPPILLQWTNTVPVTFTSEMLYMFVYNGTARTGSLDD